MNRPPLRQAAAIGLALAAIGATGWLNYRVGYDVGFLVLYTLPVAWIAWSVNLPWGLALSLGGVGSWFCADRAGGHVYAQPWIAWERAAMILLILAFVAFSFHRFRKSLESEDRKLSQLEGILPICIVCKRISDSRGNWTDLPSFLQAHGATRTDSRLCPDCAKARYH